MPRKYYAEVRRCRQGRRTRRESRWAALHRSFVYTHGFTYGSTDAYLVRWPYSDSHGSRLSGLQLPHTK